MYFSYTTIFLSFFKNHPFQAFLSKTYIFHTFKKKLHVSQSAREGWALAVASVHYTFFLRAPLLKLYELFLRATSSSLIQYTSAILEVDRK